MSHRSRAKPVASGFARWLSPTPGVVVPARPFPAPRKLPADRRYSLENPVGLYAGAENLAVPEAFDLPRHPKSLPT